jgi:m7GpppX diphosphatase
MQRAMKNRAVRIRSRNVIHETATAYRSLVMQEFIQSEIFKKQWIYKIIAGEKEQEQVIYKCDDFVILPDSENNDDPSVLNWMVIFTDTGLISMRCLRGEHLSVLKCIKAKILQLLPPEFDSPMLYYHYPPSVWQLHLHVAAPCDILRTTNSMQKVYFLEDVISNISIDPDYYAKATMTYILPSNHELTQLHARPLQIKPWTDDVSCKG